MSSCEKVIQTLWQYLDHEIGSADVIDIERHLELCRSCFSRIEFEKVLREQMRIKTHHTCPDKLRKRIESLIEKF